MWCILEAFYFSDDMKCRREQWLLFQIIDISDEDRRLFKWSQRHNLDFVL